MHELLGDAAETADGRGERRLRGDSCTCGSPTAPGTPELDVRSIPHAIGDATIFGALESVRPGAGLELVAPHDPLPMLDQVDRRWPGAISVTYGERAPRPGASAWCAPMHPFIHSFKPAIAPPWHTRTGWDA